ncbi:MAG: glycosyltransferase family 4 protein [Opitutaceae bacterium]|nr:glycosyltransferase family 4 protein [Opitutaceae bacterium]
MSRRIVYDGHIFRWQTYGGVSRYFCEIISRSRLAVGRRILGVGAVAGITRTGVGFSPPSRIKPRRISQAIVTEYWARRYLSRGCVFHPTNYRLSCGLKYGDLRCRLVVTVHDFIMLAYSEFREECAVMIAEQAEAIQAADHLICVSKYTESELHERYPNTRGKSSVVYHGSSFPALTEVGLQEKVANRAVSRFLFVGGRATYKNFLFILDAFHKSVKSGIPMKLVVAGAALSKEERWQVEARGLNEFIEVHCKPSEAQLHKLYLDSTALLYPSVHEGFGIPALEAMACGSLVIASSRTSLPEVVGDAGMLLDPFDTDAWVDRIVTVAKGSADLSPILRRGIARASALSWDLAAEKHDAIYLQLFG